MTQLCDVELCERIHLNVLACLQKLIIFVSVNTVESEHHLDIAQVCLEAILFLTFKMITLCVFDDVTLSAQFVPLLAQVEMQRLTLQR